MNIKFSDLNLITLIILLSSITWVIASYTKLFCHKIFFKKQFLSCDGLINVGEIDVYSAENELFHLNS